MLSTRESADRPRTIVVGVVGDRCSGSLAYALQGALAEAANLRIVQVSTGSTADRARPRLPIDVVEIVGDPGEVLSAECTHADVLVIEAPVYEASALMDPLLERLRHSAETLLVEVDRHGEVLRAYGPHGSAHEAAGAAGITHRPPHPATSAGAPGDRVIAVGVDSSPASLAAVRWAADCATLTNSTVRLVSVYGLADQGPTHRTEADAQRDIRGASAAATGARTAVIVTAGEPADCLIDAARGSSMLVLGRHGTRGMIHSALGSVGDTCARLAECPVVIVP